MIKINERKGTVALVISIEDVRKAVENMNMGYAKVDLQLTDNECMDIIVHIAEQLDTKTDDLFNVPPIESAIQILIWNTYKNRINLVQPQKDSKNDDITFKGISYSSIKRPYVRVKNVDKDTEEEEDD